MSRDPSEGTGNVGCRGRVVARTLTVPAWSLPAQVGAAILSATAAPKRWTHALAINDVVFDDAPPALIAAGVSSRGLSPRSAGEGSSSAFLRLQAQTFQTSTAAEPLNEQGWQLLDGLNRLLAHQPVSGFVTPAPLVTTANSESAGAARLQCDPDGCGELHRRLWKH